MSRRFNAEPEDGSFTTKFVGGKIQGAYGATGKNGSGAIVALKSRGGKIYWYIEFLCSEEESKINFISIHVYANVSEISITDEQEIDTILNTFEPIRKYKKYAFGMKKVDNKKCPNYKIDSDPWPTTMFNGVEWDCDSLPLPPAPE